MDFDTGGGWDGMGGREELPDCEQGFRGDGVLVDFGEGDGV